MGAGLIVKALKEEWQSEASTQRAEQQDIKQKELKKQEQKQEQERVTKLASKLIKTYNNVIDKEVDKWHGALSQEEQKELREQYDSQGTLFRQTGDDSPRYKGHIRQTYKTQNDIPEFSEWLTTYQKKKGEQIEQAILIEAMKLD